MSSNWGWTPVRTQGIWRHGPLWLKPLAAISPWMTVVVCLMMMYVLGGTMTISEGVLFDLPAEDVADGESASLVAMLLPLNNESTVFFDDARYLLNDGVARESLQRHISERLSGMENATMLVLADRRMLGGDLARFIAIARQGGVARLLFANRSPGDMESPRMAWQLDRSKSHKMRVQLFEKKLPATKSAPVLDESAVHIPAHESSDVAYSPDLMPPTMSASPPKQIERDVKDDLAPKATFSKETMLNVKGESHD